jgi:oxepin-CoA hydrolase/3-oxo-5,6-dehydrosuberyl-CoA semialdehyde dehydrogenase
LRLLESFLRGAWVAGAGARQALLDPATEEPLAEVGAAGGFAAALEFARARGGAALGALTFRERGELIRGVQAALTGARDELIGLAMRNGGNTRGDAKFDVDGAIATLSAYADLGAELGDRRALLDGDAIPLGRSSRWVGQHLLSPRPGVAVHVNAFNFPAWGLFEKAAQAWLAGMPVVTKPATSTAVVAHRAVELIVGGMLVPEGALSLVMGSPGDLTSHLGPGDVLAFTGSGDTGAHLRALPNVVAGGVRVNVEADSLNAAVLGPDLERGSATWDMLVSEIARDMTQKAGQKCTAIRRVLVPEALAEGLAEDLSERLAGAKVGNPAHDGVTMGPLATRGQLADVRARFARLRAEARPLFGGEGEVTPIGGAAGKGFFFGPVLLTCERPAEAGVLHDVEIFGPVATLLPYDGGAAEAARLVARGQGGLVASAYSDDRAFLRELVAGLAPWHGRLYLGSAKVAGQAAGPGTVLPQLVHGGPGRAGAGEELGGLRGMAFYLQRTAGQGDQLILEAIL